MTLRNTFFALIWFVTLKRKLIAWRHLAIWAPDCPFKCPKGDEWSEYKRHFDSESQMLILTIFRMLPVIQFYT